MGKQDAAGTIRKPSVPRSYWGLNQAGIQQWERKHQSISVTPQLPDYVGGGGGGGEGGAGCSFVALGVSAPLENSHRLSMVCDRRQSAIA